MSKRHAEIVGAGFAGLTAACALAQRGWSVRVHERADRLRTTGAGTRTVIGVMLGVVFFLVTRTIENGGQLFGLNPALVGWLPTAAIALCTVIAISRTR